MASDAATRGGRSTGGRDPAGPYQARRAAAAAWPAQSGPRRGCRPPPSGPRPRPAGAQTGESRKKSTESSSTSGFSARNCAEMGDGDR
eukprot:6898458-Alexandrium_andersonii.AAC.1